MRPSGRQILCSCDAFLNATDTELSLSISVVGALYTVCTGSRGILCNPATVRSCLLYCGALSYLIMHIATLNILCNAHNLSFVCQLCASRCISITCNYKSRINWIPCCSPPLISYIRSLVFRVNTKKIDSVTYGTSKLR